MISCIVPARNEQGHLRSVISEIRRVKFISEIVIIEGGSTDKTLDEAKALGQEFPELIRVAVQPGKGKFDAVRLGAELCRENLIIIWDADGTVPLESTESLISLALNSGSSVIGDRLRGEIEPGAMYKANYLGNWFFAFLWAPLLKGKIMDLLCGTKIFTKDVYLSVPEKVARHDPYGDFTLLLSARIIREDVLSMPVMYRKRRYGVTNIHRWTGGLQLLWVTFLAYKAFLTMRLSSRG